MVKFLWPNLDFLFFPNGWRGGTIPTVVIVKVVVVNGANYSWKNCFDYYLQIGYLKNKFNFD
jgi:hypothetical protein